MGEDDDMEKKAIYFGRTLEWARMALEYDPIEGMCVHCCVSWEWRIVEVSPRH